MLQVVVFVVVVVVNLIIDRGVCSCLSGCPCLAPPILHPAFLVVFSGCSSSGLAAAPATSATTEQLRRQQQQHIHMQEKLV